MVKASTAVELAKYFCECFVDQEGVRFWCDDCIPDELPGD